MKIGIIQGRLTDPAEGHQTTPANWSREFNICKDLGLSHIEWNIDFKKDRNNPIFTDPNIKKYRNMISSICFDTLVTRDSFDEEYFRQKTYFHTEEIIKLGIDRVTFPLLEAAKIKSKKDAATIVEIIKNYNQAFPSIKINLELDCKIKIVASVLSELEFCSLTYDTGNLTYSNVDHMLYIDRFFNKIENVHLKDRSATTGESFSNFKGDTPFLDIFKDLSSRNYNKIFTLQMARKKGVSEKDLIKKYTEKFRRMYE